MKYKKLTKEEQIEKEERERELCLSCTRPECTNCIASYDSANRQARYYQRKKEREQAVWAMESLKVGGKDGGNVKIAL